MWAWVFKNLRNGKKSNCVHLLNCLITRQNIRHFIGDLTFIKVPYNLPYDYKIIANERTPKSALYLSESM